MASQDPVCLDFRSHHHAQEYLLSVVKVIGDRAQARLSLPKYCANMYKMASVSHGFRTVHNYWPALGQSAISENS